MRTPAGSECPYYYEDFYRGRDQQECRLIDRTPNGGTWEPKLCASCPVPRISMANACPHLVLEARVTSGFLGMGKHVDVSAMCTQTLGDVREPQIGCGQCHLHLPPLQTSAEES